LNEEVRRREKIIRIFPNGDSAMRLIGAILIDINEDWITSSKIYIRMK
ncbi:MAG: transposase, partial [Anaerococcus sp.]